MRKSSAACLLFVLLSAFFWASQTSCVATAECDQTSPCQEEGTVCFDYKCLEVCEQDGDCDTGELCTSCLAEDACFGVALRACVEQMEEDDE